ncbi:TetR/AcrR family transcriptional regulator [Mycolicibacterium thermoresistibile]
MAQRWTRERRLEHTRTLLVDAAEEVFATKGFAAASIDDIAGAAGYTKGAVYGHFGSKEHLFLAVSDRYWRRYFDTFAELLASVTRISDIELDQIAARWRELSLSGGARQAALGHEFTLYLLRNPDARDKVAEQRRAVVESLARFVTEGMTKLGAGLTMPATTFAQLLIATSDSVILTSELDDIDLYRPMLQLYTSAIKQT